MTPTINVNEVTLLFNETFQWTFSGLNVNVLKCRLDSISIVMEQCQSNNMEYLVEETKIIIHNSSFGSLDLKSGTKALITDCYIDDKFKDRPTLITASNSDVSIQNCHFKNFINKNDSTILFGHNNSHVTIQNSVFVQHSCSKGVLFLQNNSSLRISTASISKNLAFTLGYSTITLKEGIQAVIDDTVFRNNSALAGGAVNAQNKCQVTLTNCTFSANKAIKTLTVNTEMATNSQDTNGSFALKSPISFNQTWLQFQNIESIKGEKLNISKKSNRGHLYENSIRRFAQVSPTLFNQMSRLQKPEALPSERTGNSRNSTAPNLDLNNAGTFTPMIHMLSDQTSSDAKESEASTPYQTHHLIKSSILRNIVLEEGYPPGMGGAVFLASHSHLLVTNCTFEDNLAQDSAGAIVAGLYVTLDVRDTTFVNNKGFEGRRSH